MARRLRSNLLESRTSRARLARRTKPYWFKIASGIALGYRANENAGTWSVRAADGKGGNWIKSFAVADDREDADGTVLDFWQAADKAKQLARGKDADAGRPATVAEAIRDYATDLKVRGANPENATRLLNPLPPSLKAKPVSLLTMKELRAWRNSLAGSMKASSVNRLCKVLKAALSLAASHDRDRITNAVEWRDGLKLIPEDDDTESNIVLSDEQRRDLIASAEAISPEFGLYVWAHAEVGARTSQLALLDVGDLQTGAKPLLMVPSSLKGKARRTRTKKPVPITPGLAKRLKVAAAGRDADQPLLVNPDGERWSARAHRRPFAEAAKAAGLPPGVTCYALRHTAITRALLANVPVRLVAASFDTSVEMIERSYSKFIADHGDSMMRKALFDVTAPADSNVVAMRR